MKRPLCSTRARAVGGALVLSIMIAAACLVFAQAPVPAPNAPVVVVETTQGVFAFSLNVREAPVSSGHIVQLVQQHFYDGQRVHRVVPGVLVQFGDPRTRDLDRRALWGMGTEASSGTPVGAVEIPERQKHVPGAIGLAHMGEPAKADSQIYVMLDSRPELDGRYAVIGRIVEGGDIPAKLQAGDQLLRVYLRE